MLLVATALSGCMTGVRTETLSVVSTPDANQGFATRVDLVWIKAPDLVPVIAGLSATEWFAGKSELQSAHGGELTVLSLELPAAYHEAPLATPQGGEALFVFARYLTPGEHRVRIDAIKHAHIRLERTGFRVDAL